MDFRVIILGQAGVGKTSIIRRLSQNTFIRGQETNSLDKEFIDHSIRTRLGDSKLRIWDTAEMERYHSSLPSSLYRRKHGIILVYSLTSKESLRNVNQWLSNVQSYYSEESYPTFILLANKTDDILHKECSIRDGTSMYNRLKCFGTSALTGEGIKEAFEYLAGEMLGLEMKRLPHSDKYDSDESYGLEVNSSAVDTPFKFVTIMKNCSLL